MNTKEGLLVRKAYPGRGGAQWFNYNSKNDKFNKTSFTALFPDTVGALGDIHQTKEPLHYHQKV